MNGAGVFRLARRSFRTSSLYFITLICMKYFLGKNGQEYIQPEDAELYGGGLEGWREVTIKEEKITYQKLTGKEIPESPVDNVLKDNALKKSDAEKK